MISPAPGSPVGRVAASLRRTGQRIASLQFSLLTFLLYVIACPLLAIVVRARRAPGGWLARERPEDTAERMRREW